MIIFVILMTLMCDTGVLLFGEIRLEIISMQGNTKSIFWLDPFLVIKA